jgi:lambda family phage tail tape measure protein
MATIEEFILKFKTQGAEQITAATNGIKNLGQQVSNLASSGGGLQGILSGIAGSMGPIAAGGLAVAGAFGAMAMKAINMADALGDIADATGVSSGALNNLKNSLITAGGRAEDFATLATRLNKNVGEAASGNETLQKSFRTLGVFVTDANGNLRNTGDILRDVIGRLAAIEDPATRAKLAVEFFGKEAAKLDFTKLNAVNDPFTEEKQKQLAKYRDAIDAISVAASDKLLSVFGQLAIKMNEASARAIKLEEEANARGNVGPRVTAIGGSIAMMPERPMSKAEKDRYDLAEKLKEAYKDQGREMRKLESIGKEGGGGFGGPSEATLKAAAESEKRLRQSTIEFNRNVALRGANDIQAIEENAAAEIAKANENIYSQERLTRQQKDNEFAAKRLEIQSKADNDIAKNRAQLNARIFSQEEAERQAGADAIAAQQRQFDSATKTARERADAYAQSVIALEDQILLEKTLVGMNSNQAAMYRQIAEEVKKRSDAIRELANVENLSYKDRLEQEARIREESGKAIDLIKKRSADDLARSQNLTAGLADAWTAYKENALRAADQIKSSFDNSLSGLEDAFVRFVQTGKLSFRDLANSIISDLAKIAFKRAIVGMGSLFGFAAGGQVMADTPIIVGERGPELFVPRSAGAIVPNNALGGMSGRSNEGGGQTMVTYNIQAVDAASFRSLVARDPSFIYAVTEQGRRSQPTRSR